MASTPAADRISTITRSILKAERGIYTVEQLSAKKRLELLHLEEEEAEARQQLARFEVEIANRKRPDFFLPERCF